MKLPLKQDLTLNLTKEFAISILWLYVSLSCLSPVCLGGAQLGSALGPRTCRESTWWPGLLGYLSWGSEGFFAGWWTYSRQYSPDKPRLSCDYSVYAHRSSLVLRFSHSSVTPICFPGGVEWSESECAENKYERSEWAERVLDFVPFPLDHCTSCPVHVGFVNKCTTAVLVQLLCACWQLQLLYDILLLDYPSIHLYCSCITSHSQHKSVFNEWWKWDEFNEPLLREVGQRETGVPPLTSYWLWEK